MIVAPDYEATYAPDRAVIVGHCPEPPCGRVLVLMNDGRVWPPASCPCGWVGDTLELVNRVRLDRGWLVSDEGGRERELRT